MYAAQTELKNAQKVKEFLITKKLFHPDYTSVKEFGLIYFPIIKKTKVPGAKVVAVSFSFPRKVHQASMPELLKGKLTSAELAILPTSQEVVGKILILEIPEELQQKERVIAQAYLTQSHHVETVVKKAEFHEGDYRLRKVQVLAGKNTKETIHQENGVKIKLDLEKTYFSARSSNERLRIAKQVTKGEEVLVMFSGAAPYPLVIAKNSPAKLIYGIELNPLAHQYALQSVELNHLSDRIIILQGDVRTITPTLNRKFDRIIMPLPKTAEDFLESALCAAKKKAIIHLYAFLAKDDIKAAGKRIQKLCTGYGHSVKILRAVTCGQFSPRTFRICFDLKLNK
ncbi:MAG TPA: class I SAM-dependent methyltransferase family protein [Candidatus Nanoarchaeia archaeon]|nr:class I SAM-dependent methyltransferase family protein [Candidatus Nanoarchaeia archaeon]